MRAIFFFILSISVAAIVRAAPVTEPAPPAPIEPAPLPATAPVSQPARPHASTQPTTVPADLSTPKSTLRSLNISLRDGDADGIRRALMPANPQEQQVVGAMADFAAALATLHRSAADVFGPEGAKTITGDTESESTEGLAAIEHATVTVDGNNASVQYLDAKDAPIRLQRSGEEWRLPVSQFVQVADQSLIADHVARLLELSKQARQISGEIKKGEFSSAERAAISWKTRSTQVLTPRPTSGPTTEPATKP